MKVNPGQRTDRRGAIHRFEGRLLGTTLGIENHRPGRF